MRLRIVSRLLCWVTGERRGVSPPVGVKNTGGLTPRRSPIPSIATAHLAVCSPLPRDCHESGPNAAGGGRPTGTGRGRVAHTDLASRRRGLCRGLRAGEGPHDRTQATHPRHGRLLLLPRPAL